jgi:hypothetical protein
MAKQDARPSEHSGVRQALHALIEDLRRRALKNERRGPRQEEVGRERGRIVQELISIYGMMVRLAQDEGPLLPALGPELGAGELLTPMSVAVWKERWRTAYAANVFTLKDGRRRFDVRGFRRAIKAEERSDGVLIDQWDGEQVHVYELPASSATGQAQCKEGEL